MKTFFSRSSIVRQLIFFCFALVVLTFLLLLSVLDSWNEDEKLFTGVLGVILAYFYPYMQLQTGQFISWWDIILSHLSRLDLWGRITEISPPFALCISVIVNSCLAVSSASLEVLSGHPGKWLSVHCYGCSLSWQNWCTSGSEEDFSLFKSERLMFIGCA